MTILKIYIDIHESTIILLSDALSIKVNGCNPATEVSRKDLII